ncbi:unnamed protein product [Ectocarpus sp. 12 AP-2014]
MVFMFFSAQVSPFFSRTFVCRPLREENSVDGSVAGRCATGVEHTKGYQRIRWSLVLRTVLYNKRVMSRESVDSCVNSAGFGEDFVQFRCTHTKSILSTLRSIFWCRVVSESA